VEGLKFGVPVGGTWEEVRPSIRERRIPKGAKVLRKAMFSRHMDTLIGALEGSVRFLGKQRSTAYWMGVTGHAFRICVVDSLGVDGPMKVEVPRMLPLYEHFGYSIHLISAQEGTSDFRDKQQEAWDVIRESIDWGVPVVVRFGPFFWLVKGYHPKREEYYLSAFMPRLEEPVGMDELGMDQRVGGLEVLVLGEPREVDSTAVERRSLEFAVAHARFKDASGGRYHRGFSAFEHWITDIEGGRISEGFGPAYTAVVVTEARGYAGVYLNEIAEHYPEETAVYLREAVHGYGMEVERLKKVTEVFPLMSRREQVNIENPEERQQVVGWLREALSWERKAVKALEEALAAMP